MFKHILIPTDGSPQSLAAAKAAIDLARSVGARVTALFAAPAPTPLIYEGFLPVGYLPPDQHAGIIEQAARNYLGAIEAAARAVGVPCDCVQVQSEYPAETILETARSRKCDLIAMAAHGRRGLSRMLAGSETLRVLNGTEIPLLIYRSA
jgi:nucleotide-binding universal stress UspA family protein